MTLTLAEPMTIERDGKTIVIPARIPFEIEVGDIVKDYKVDPITLGFMQAKKEFKQEFKQEIKQDIKPEKKEVLNG
jgi:hypothetical protein